MSPLFLYPDERPIISEMVSAKKFIGKKYNELKPEPVSIYAIYNIMKKPKLST